MATCSPPVTSLASIIKTYEHWLHYGTFVHEPLKESLLGVLHNSCGDTSYNGLPTNPADLYNSFDKHHKLKLNKLLQKGVLNKDQMQLIFPPNKQETYSNNFDVTLLVVLIINCCNLPPPVKGWKDKNPPLSDQSKSANVIRARELRNFFHHTDPKIFDKQTFDDKWLEGDKVVNSLSYKYDSQALKTASLDPTKLSVLHSLLQFLQIKQDTIQKQIDSNAEDMKLSFDDIKKKTSSNTEDIKKNSEDQLQHTTRLEKDLKDQLEHNKRLDKELLDACMQMETLKEQMFCLQNEQLGIYLYYLYFKIQT